MIYSRTSAEARASRQELPRDALEALFDVMDLLCEEPLKGRALGEGVRVYKHPEPPMQVIYRFNEAESTIEFLDFAARIVCVVRNVFISYSHEDREWFELVRQKLGLLEDLGVSFWSDIEIEPGADWDRLIVERLDASRAALLLVSGAFLGSSYIMSRELPALLVKLDGAPKSFKLLWFLVTPCDLMSNEMGRKIAQRQSLLPLNKPLASLKGNRRRDFLEDLQQRIARAVAN